MMVYVTRTLDNAAAEPWGSFLSWVDAVQAIFEEHQGNCFACSDEDKMEMIFPGEVETTYRLIEV